MEITGTHANFSVDDIEKAKQFYTSLGFTVKDEHAGGIFLESPAGTHVEIYEKGDHQPWNATVLGIEVMDVGATVKELAAMNVRVEPVEGADEYGIAHMDGFEAAWVKDPAQNWICFSNIGAHLEGARR